MFCIAIEHLVIGIKVIIAILIPDLPEKVVIDEKRRVKLIKQAHKEMRQLKQMGNHETLEEI